MTVVAAYPGLNAAIQAFDDSVGRVRQDLYYCDVSFAHARTRELRSSIHAAAYVYSSAALERFVNDLLVATINEISAATISLSKLKLSLFSILQAPHFESLQQVRGLKMWHKRAEVFSAIDHGASCLLSEEFLPLDGRTIRKDHLETIWKIFDLPGPSVPSPLHTVALNSLADARNRVTHGEEQPSVVAGENSITDTLKLLDKVYDIALHLWDTFVNYLSVKGYMR